MTAKEEAARALDMTMNLGDDKARETLALWLDGQIRIPARTVRCYSRYILGLSKKQPA